MVPEHVEQIFSAIVVMKQRGIEAAAVQINRIRPLTIYVCTGNQVVMKIAKRRASRTSYRRAAITFYICIDQIEEAIGVAQTWRPYSAGIRIAEQVKLTGPSKRSGNKLPVNQITRMMNLH